MSWSDEFGKLPITAKGVAASVAVIMPFWFISLYLFHKPLFLQNNYYVVLSFCFCLSLTWYFITIVFSAIALAFTEKDDSINSILLAGGITSIVYLCLAIIVAYYFKWTFIYFLMVAYSYVFLRIIIVLLAILIKAISKPNN